MNRPAFSALLLLSACTDRDVIIAPTNGAKALIVVTAAGGTPISAQAFDVGADSSFYSLPVPEEDADVFLLGYACSLEDLALAPGPLSLVGEGRGRKLGNTAAIMRAEVRGGEASAFSRTETDLLDKIKVDAPPWKRCATFNFIRHELSQDTYAPTYAVPIGTGEVLVADSSGRAFRVGKNMFRLLAPNPEIGAAAAFAGPDRGIWLIGTNELVTLADATLANIQRFSRIQSNSIEYYAWISGSPEPELFVLTDHQAIAYKFGIPGEWQTLSSSTAVNIGRAGRIAWIAPGEAFVLREPDLPNTNSDLIEHVQAPSRITPMRIPIDMQVDGRPERPTEVAFVPGIGAVVGTRRGLFFRWDGVEWVRMVTSVNIGRVRDIVPLHGGFLAAGDGGRIAQFDPTLGDFCPSITIGSQEIGFLAPVGEDFLAVTDNDFGEAGIEAFYLTTSPKPAECALP